MSRPPVRDDEALLLSYSRRIRLLERRLEAKGGGGNGGSSTPYDAEAGLMMAHAGGPIPSGWLLCDGTAVQRAGYPELYQKIGTTWGAGDGSTTFNLPNLKGRAIVGRDPADATFDVIGETGGAKTHTLTIAEMPGHTHQNSVASNWAINAGGTGNGRANDGAGPYNTSSTGGGGAHNNLQPFAVANYIISTGSGVGGGGSSVPALPAPVTVFSTSDSVAITQAGAVWADVPGAAYTYTLDQPMWVEIEFGAQTASTDASAYAMIGVAATGALNLDPVTDQGSGSSNRFAFTPFAYGDSRRAAGSKTLLLPVGTTTLKVQSRRNSAVGAQSLSYINMILMPLAWVGAPGAVLSSGGMVGVAPKSIATVGGTAVQLGHKVSFDAVSKVSLNGVFDRALAEDYVIEAVITSGTQGGWIRLRKAGVDTEGAVYGNQQTYNNAAGSLATGYAATIGWVFIPVVGLGAKFTAKISGAPNPNPQTCWLDLSAGVLLSSGMSNGSSKGTTSAQGYDGFTIATASGTISGWLRVYALT